MEQAVLNQQGGTLAQRLLSVKRAASDGLPGATLTTVANEAGINRSIVSQIANGCRIPSDAQEQALWAALATMGLADAADAPVADADHPADEPLASFKGAVELYETEEFSRAMGWCEGIFRKRKLGVMTGDPGIGKTTILMEYAKRRPEARYMKCWALMRMSDLLGMIGRDLGVKVYGSLFNQQQQIVRALENRTDYMLLLDEAEFLKRWDVLKIEVLREIFDATATPIVFAGTKALREMMMESGRDNLAQLYSREWECQMRGITAKEARSILRAYNLSADAAEEMTRVALDAQHGGMRTFVGLLDLCLEAADGNRIDANILAGARRYGMMH